MSPNNRPQILVCDDEELDDLLAFVRKHSPVCETVCRPVPVIVERVNVGRSA